MIPDEAVIAGAAAIQVRLNKNMGLNDLTRAVLDAAAEHLFKNMRQMSLVEIEERDNPGRMKAARERIRAERREVRAAEKALWAEQTRADQAEAWDRGMADMLKLQEAGPGYEMANPYRSQA